MNYFNTSKHLKCKSGAGFTIIELVVVIAIIAVLSAIVLTNVLQYIGKGRDTAIKGQVGQMRTAAVKFFDDNGKYDNMCISGTECYTIKSNILNLHGQFSSIFATGGVYCFSVILNSGGHWCVDNTGYTGSSDNCNSSPYSCSGS